ncbi:MAG: hypothetical protein IJ083_06375 [Clostridia bacterium]|nr:hypothetical protein [Clostridia bacterium]
MTLPTRALPADSQMAKLPDRFAQILTETDLNSTLERLQSMQDADAAAALSLISTLRLKLRVGENRLRRLLEEGEALSENHRLTAGEDFTYTMQQSVLLSPIRDKIREWDMLSQDLKAAEAAIQTSSRQQEAYSLARLLHEIGKV